MRRSKGLFVNEALIVKKGIQQEFGVSRHLLDRMIATDDAFPKEFMFRNHWKRSEIEQYFAERFNH